MKILNNIIKETYIKDEIKNYKKNKEKFNNKYKTKISTDIIKIFTEINKILSKQNDITKYNIIFKEIKGNSTKKELTFIVNVNNKDKTIIIPLKNKDISKIIKSKLSINIKQFNNIIHNNNKSLKIFMDFEDIIENIIDYINIFNKINIIIN